MRMIFIHKFSDIHQPANKEFQNIFHSAMCFFMASGFFSLMFYVKKTKYVLHILHFRLKIVNFPQVGRAFQTIQQMI